MANFSWTPEYVYPEAPEFPVVITQSDSYKKNYQLIATTATERFTLYFKKASTATRNDILSHYNTTGYGNYASFSWTTVPTYIKSAASQTVRYISYKEEPIEAGLWDIWVGFEIDV